MRIRRLGLVAVAACVLSVPVAVPPASARSSVWPAAAVPGRLLVTAVDHVAASRLAVETGGRQLGRTVVVSVPVGHETAEAGALRARTGVLAVEPDHLRPMLVQPDDPLFVDQWAHAVARTPAAWDVTTGSSDVTVAVIDTGVDATHPDLRSNIVTQVDVSDGFPVEAPLGSDNDPCALGHGTQVAGLIGAVGDNDRDVAGVAWEVGIIDISAADRVACGQFSDSAVIAGLTYARNRSVDVINLSLGSPGDACPTAYQAAINEARAQGSVVVAAVGNDEQFVAGITTVPASCNGVISVGAVDANGAPAAYSNANDQVDLAAPGGGIAGPGILSTAHGGGTTSDIGTSFAAPFVVGAAALIRSVNPELTADQVESVLESTARTSSQRRTDIGWGVVDIGAAVARAGSSAPIAPPAPDPPFPVGLVVRVGAQTLITDPVLQAVAMSRYVFPTGSAQHAVVARRDDFADALSGSALSFGAGPILYSDRTGPLAGPTATELQRVVEPGAVVYLLGGTAALPDTLEGEIRALGLHPVRLAGPTRSATAAVVANEVKRRIVELQFDAPDRVLLATGRNWPDAVTAGSFAAWNGYPVLLTEPGGLPPETRDALGTLHPRRIYVVGGTSVISDEVAAAAGAAAGTPDVLRLAGTDRVGTALAVAERFALEFKAETNLDPLLVVGVNLRRSDGYTHVLSAAPAIGAYSGVYLPIEGEGGDSLPAGVITLSCRLSPLRGIVAGEGDAVADAVKQRLDELLEHRAPECATP